MISIEKALKFPFKESNWMKTVGVYFLVLLTLATITFIVQLFFQLPAEILDSIAQESGETSLQVAALGANFAYLAVSLIISIVTFPVTLYLSGYVFDTVRHLMNGKENAITAHGNYLFRIKIGLVRMLVSIILGFLSLFTLVIPTIVIIAGALTMETSAILAFILLAFGFLLSISWLVFTILGVKLVQYAMEYIYLKSGFKYIFNLNRIFRLIKTNFKSLIMLLAVEVLTGMINAFAFILFCLVFFVQPAVSTALTFSLAYYYGETFRGIKEA